MPPPTAPPPLPTIRFLPADPDAKAMAKATWAKESAPEPQIGGYATERDEFAADVSELGAGWEAYENVMDLMGYSTVTRDVRKGIGKDGGQGIGVAKVALAITAPALHARRVPRRGVSALSRRWHPHTG